MIKMYKTLSEYKKNEELYLQFENALLENAKSNMIDIIDKQLYKLRKRLNVNVKQQIFLDKFLE